MPDNCLAYINKEDDGFFYYILTSASGSVIMMQKFISITEAIVFAELFAEKNTDPATKIADGKIFTSTEGEPKNWFDEYVKKRGIETLGLEELVREIKEPERAAWKEKYMSVKQAK